MLEPKVAVKELGKSIHWSGITIVISGAKVDLVEDSTITKEMLNSDIDGFIVFARKIKEVIKMQTPRKTRKDKNIPRKNTLVGSVNG